MSPARPGGQVALTVLCGLDGARVADLGAGLLLRGEPLVLVHVDPWTADLGHVECRVTDSAGRCTTQAFALEHDCLSCTVRETIATTVRRLRATGRYDAVLVHLHPGTEVAVAVASLAQALAGEAVIDTVVADLEPEWLVRLGSDADLASIGAAVGPEDRRGVAGVLASALDAASVLVLAGTGPRPDALDAHAALGALCPTARRIYPPTPFDLDAADAVQTGSFHPSVLALLTRGGLLSPLSEYVSARPALRLVRWEADAPLHPARLHDALERLAAGVIRSSGRLWFATHPDLVVGWDSAGEELALGPEAVWPQPVGARPRPSPSRWNGRHNVLAFLGEALDAEAIHAVLDACVLTEAELAAGPSGWRALTDPFPEWGTRGDEGRGAA